MLPFDAAINALTASKEALYMQIVNMAAVQFKISLHGYAIAIVFINDKQVTADVESWHVTPSWVWHASMYYAA